MVSLLPYWQYLNLLNPTCPSFPLWHFVFHITLRKAFFKVIKYLCFLLVHIWLYIFRSQFLIFLEFIMIYFKVGFQLFYVAKMASWIFYHFLLNNLTFPHWFWSAPCYLTLNSLILFSLILNPIPFQWFIFLYCYHTVWIAIA